MREKIEQENVMFTSPEEMLAAAKAEKPQPTSRTMLDYLPVITELRGKGFTWKECAEWIREHGYPASQESVSSCWHKNANKG